MHVTHIMSVSCSSLCEVCHVDSAEQLTRLVISEYRHTSLPCCRKKFHTTCFTQHLRHSINCPACGKQVSDALLNKYFNVADEKISDFKRVMHSAEFQQIQPWIIDLHVVGEKITTAEQLVARCPPGIPIGRTDRFVLYDSYRTQNNSVVMLFIDPEENIKTVRRNRAVRDLKKLLTYRAAICTVLHPWVTSRESPAQHVAHTHRCTVL